ncbi:hypothetical protein SCLCIDRAFT_264714 [Scleroderma citrinum Foug A]|uniref:Uncharacterized protein n=1 Tax=Scleroderma citrinum Foug A TaxID=1036808 RepID=A0A0C2ZZW3_9AGAM|nr:hypothetical protein SCLCIDRAFT_264714 [Scleroderma citrinum Foug A]
MYPSPLSWLVLFLVASFGVVFPVDASHSSTNFSHARRSLLRNRQSGGLLDGLGGVVGGLGDTVGGLLGGLGLEQSSSTTSSTTTTTTSSTTSTSSHSTTTTTSLETQTTSPTTTSSPTTSTCNGLLGLGIGCLATSSTPTESSSPTTTTQCSGLLGLGIGCSPASPTSSSSGTSTQQTSPTSSSPTTTSCSGLLGLGVGCPASSGGGGLLPTSVLGPVTSAILPSSGLPLPTSILGPVTSAILPSSGLPLPTSVLGPVTSAILPSSGLPLPTSVLGPVTSAVLPSSGLPLPTSVLGPVTSAILPSSGLPLPTSVLGPVTSALLPSSGLPLPTSVLGPVTSAILPSSGLPLPTSVLGPVTSAVLPSSGLPLPTSVLGPVTSAVLPSSGLPLPTTALGPVTSALLPSAPDSGLPIPTSTLGSVTSTLVFPPDSGLPLPTSALGSVTSALIPSAPDSGLSIPTSVLGPLTSVLPPSIPPDQSSVPISGLPGTSSSSVCSIVNGAPQCVSATSTSASTITFPTHFSAPSGPPTFTNTNYNFLTSVQSLLLDTQTPTSTLQMTNPDQAATTQPLSSGALTSTPSAAPLPSGLPSVILPQPQLNLSLVPTDYVLINILFNNSLNWEFVATNADSPGQIFAYFPDVIATALGTEASQIMNYDLIVYIPSSYSGPQDVDQLGTIWQGYIPSDKVSTLASLISNQKSVFYTGQTGPIPSTLAACVDPSFQLDAISGPKAGGSSSSSSSGTDTRRDAIIGVVSSLGAIAVIIVAYVGYRSYKRRREGAHHRIGDTVGVRPEGQEFDRDSLGEQRRRSFYYAEDSLRGYQGAHAEDDAYGHHPSGIRERRPIFAGAISTPILRESTMNW